MLNFATILWLIITAPTIWALSLGDEMHDFAGQTYAGELQNKPRNQVLVEIPNVVGMTYPEAQAELYDLGLTSAKFIKVTESGAGLVVDQLPAPGMKVAKGTRVTLTVNQALPLEDGNDGCISQGQTCVCINTGWERHCDYGPHRTGLYCQCD